VEYAMVGDPVNVASRVEGLTKDLLTKELQTPILLSEATAAQLPVFSAKKGVNHL
jgi:class 3 adenylate cyclase